jgi:FkbM family methyltransferase
MTCEQTNDIAVEKALDFASVKSFGPAECEIAVNNDSFTFLIKDALSAPAGIFVTGLPELAGVAVVRGHYAINGSVSLERYLEAYVEAQYSDEEVDYSYDVKRILMTDPSADFSVDLCLPANAKRVLIGVRSLFRYVDMIRISVNFSVKAERGLTHRDFCRGKLKGVYKKYQNNLGAYPVSFNKSLHDIVLAGAVALYADGPGGDILDIGANVGEHSVQFAKLLRDGAYRVVCIEPNPLVNQFLYKNLEGFASCSLILPVAIVGLERTQVEFYINEQASELGSLRADYLDAFFPGEFDAGKGKTLVVNALTIDQLVARENLKVALAKIDVESLEFDILRYCRSLFESRAIIIFEFNSKTYSDRGRQFLELFLFHRYRVYDCFLNELTVDTWDVGSPIDRFAIPVEVAPHSIMSAKLAIKNVLANKLLPVS